MLQRRAARLDAQSPERPYHLLYALHSQVVGVGLMEMAGMAAMGMCLMQPALTSRCSNQPVWCCLPAGLSPSSTFVASWQRGAHVAAAGAMLAWARRLQAGHPPDAATLHLVQVALGAQWQRLPVLRVPMHHHVALNFGALQSASIPLLPHAPSEGPPG